jgi:hypothetical protein
MENGAGATPALAEGLPTRWRPLYDDYGPLRLGFLRRSAVPSPEPPQQPLLSCCISSASRLRGWLGCDDPASRGGALREPSYG